ncbi:MAG TPA: serine hydrolase domain-containing protein, partial [Micromonosporaceae bacterium]
PATADQIRRMPGQFMDGVLQDHSQPSVYLDPPPFPSGAGGLLSTIDDYLRFARLLRNGGTHDGVRLLSSESVAAMTTNQLTDEQIAAGGMLLGDAGWGYGMAVIVTASQPGLATGQYGWSGGSGTTWFNDPSRDLIAVAMTQASDFLWNGGLTDFDELAAAAVVAS